MLVLIVRIIASLFLLLGAIGYRRVTSTGRKRVQWDISTGTAAGKVLQLNSPAKLNLFLRVTGKYPNGYHQLCSLFQTVSLFDIIHVANLEDGATRDDMTCSDSLLVVDSSNLVIKALELMRAKTNIKQYFKVHLEKNIPMQAGLGGGSSNAATAMHAFNTLCGYPASSEQMQTWSAEIGSDISFFFSSGTAYCTGRGEHVRSLQPLPVSEHLQVHTFKPTEGLSTAKVFQQLQLQDCSTVPPLELLQHFQTHGALDSAAHGLLVNDLESAAFQLMPQLGQLKELAGTQWAGAGGAVQGAMMTGSGSCVFTLVDTRDRDGAAPTLPAAASPHKNQVSTALGTLRITSREPLPACFGDLALQHFQCRFVQRDHTDVRAWY